MPVSVQMRADFVATFRWTEVQLMEMLAGWIASTPEMEIKVLFGRHVWACAQHADALGKRSAELRAPLHANREPVSGYRQLLESAVAADRSSDRIAWFYDVILPGLAAKYRAYLDWTDSLMDEPTVSLMQTILLSIDQMTAECAGLRAALPVLPPSTCDATDTVTDFVVPRPMSRDTAAAGA